MSLKKAAGSEDPTASFLLLSSNVEPIVEPNVEPRNYVLEIIRRYFRQTIPLFA